MMIRTEDVIENILNEFKRFSLGCFLCAFLVSALFCFEAVIRSGNLSDEMVLPLLVMVVAVVVVKIIKEEEKVENENDEEECCFVTGVH